MNIKQLLSPHIKIDGVSSEEIAEMFSTPADSMFADAALPCFRLSKTLRMAPQQIAENLAKQFPALPLVNTVEAVNGYLNFTLNPAAFSAQVVEEILTDADFGKSNRGAGKTICLDYSSVNIAKTFHIGHLGTTAIGNSLKNLFEFCGYKTVGINHLGDWGTQFGKLIVAFKRWGDKQKIEKGGVEALQEIYVKFHAEEEKDASLTDEARAWFKRIEEGDAEALQLFDWFKQITMVEVETIYKRLGVKFDYYQGESFYNDKMDEVLELARKKGIVAESDGAQVVMLDDFNMPPCLLVKADGATLYATRDLAAALYRKRTFDFDKCLYVVAYQQNLHFKQVFKVLELMGFDWAKDMEHIAYGMVSLEDGPMSTRKGNYVKLSDLLDRSVEKSLQIIEEKSPDLKDKQSAAEKIGVGAVIFSALQNARIKDNVFSFEKVLNFDGETCPYIQYTIARTNSVLEKAGSFAPRFPFDASALDNAETKDVAKLLNRFPEIVLEATEKREPCILSKYLVDCAQAFNRFYFAHRILGGNENEQLPRLMLTQAAGMVMKKGLGLLGIGAPEKM